MSLTGALSSAISGIRANQEQIQTLSNNVSNAGVEGFSRKVLPQSTNVFGLGQNGGVQTGEVQREVDEFLTQQIRQGESTLTFEQTKSEFYQRVQDFFGRPDSNTNLSNSISELSAAIEDLAINPENSASRVTVVDAAVNLTNQFNSFSQETQDLRVEADAQVEIRVRRVNENLREIRELNAQIAQANALDRSTAELEDKRDVALKELSQDIDIQTFDKSTGEIVVLTGNGSRTLVNSATEQLSFTPSGSLGAGETGSTVRFSDGTALESGEIGGRLGALLQIRDEDLPNFQADMDRLAAQLREQVNEVHNLATPGNDVATAATGLTGDHAFANTADTLTSGTINIATAGTALETDPNIPAGATIDFTISDGTNTYTVTGFDTTDNLTAIATDIDAQADFAASVTGGPGNFSLEISSDPAGTPVSITDNVGTFASDVGLSNPLQIDGASGNVQLVPVVGGDVPLSGTTSITLDLGAAFTTAQGASLGTGADISQFVTALNGQVGAANPFAFNGDGQLTLNDPFGDGTDFILRQNPNAPGYIDAGSIGPTATDANNDGTRDRNFSHFFGFNNFFQTPDTGATDANGNDVAQIASSPDLVTGDRTGPNDEPARTGAGASAATVIQVNQAIVNDASRVARIAPGNTPGTNPLPVGDPTISERLAAVFDSTVDFAAPTVFETGGAAGLATNPAGGNLGSRTVTLSNFAGDLLQFQAGETSRLQNSVEGIQSVQDQLQLRADSVSGVNLNEELANLTNFQQAFNANARIVSVVEELFTTLNRMGA